MVDLNSSDYLYVLERVRKEKLAGAIIYDALISHAAAKVDTDYHVTFNEKDFKRVSPENGAELVIP